MHFSAYKFLKGVMQPLLTLLKVIKCWNNSCYLFFCYQILLKTFHFFQLSCHDIFWCESPAFEILGITITPHIGFTHKRWPFNSWGHGVRIWHCHSRVQLVMVLEPRRTKWFVMRFWRHRRVFSLYNAYNSDVGTYGVIFTLICWN